MAYVGNTPSRGQWRKLTDISASFNGVTTTFTTSVPPGTSAYYVTAGTASQLIISLGGVIQEPDVDYTVSTNSITFTTAPAAGLSFFGVLCGDALNAGVPSDGSVSTSKLGTNLTVDLASGNAAAPSLTFDANTGVYSPGEDQVAISTNGTGRLFVDASGNIAINRTLGAGRRVDITESSSTGNGALRLRNDQASVYIDAGVWGSAAATYGGIAASSAFLQATNANLAVQTEGGAFPIIFAPNASERMRLDSSGRLGLGTSSPGAALNIGADGDFWLGSNVNTVEEKNLISWRIEDGSEGARISAYREALANAPHGIAFATRTTSGSVTEKVRIDSSGRVGVGTASPSELLSLYKDSNPFIGIQNSTTGTASTDGGYVGMAGLLMQITNKENAPIAFSTNNTEVARIDSSGRLLVGTSSNRTGAALQVEGTTFGTSLATIANNSANSAPAYFQLIKSRGTAVGSQTLVSNGDGLGNVQFVGTDGTQQLVAAAIEGIVDGTPGANDMPGRIVLSTTADGASSPTERLRIDNAGASSIISTNFGLDISTTQGAGATNLINGRYSGTAGTVNSGTLCYAVVSNGDVLNTNNSYGALSDIKLKENIVDATSQWNDIKSLQVRKYNFKEGQTHTQIGLVAQEVELVSPGLVTESPDRDEDGNDLGTVTKSVNYSVLYMKAVKALQEAMERIETLEAKVAALEGA